MKNGFASGEKISQFSTLNSQLKTKFFNSQLSILNLKSEVAINHSDPVSAQRIDAFVRRVLGAAGRGNSRLGLGGFRRNMHVRGSTFRGGLPL